MNNILPDMCLKNNSGKLVFIIRIGGKIPTNRSGHYELNYSNIHLISEVLQMLVFYFYIAANLTAKRKNSFTPYEHAKHEELEMGQYLKHHFALTLQMVKWSRKED